MSRVLLILILIPFGALTAVAVWQHGYWGIIAPQLQSTAGAQVLADLSIALTLSLVWMWGDARAHGRAIWPWILVTLTLGSFGPLLYLLTRRPVDSGR